MPGVVPPVSFGAPQPLIIAKAAPRIMTNIMRRSREDRGINGIPKGMKINARAASAKLLPRGHRELLADGLAAV